MGLLRSAAPGSEDANGRAVRPVADGGHRDHAQRPLACELAPGGPARIRVTRRVSPPCTVNVRCAIVRPCSRRRSRTRQSRAGVRQATRSRTAPLCDIRTVLVTMPTARAPRPVPPGRPCAPRDTGRPPGRGVDWSAPVRLPLSSAARASGVTRPLVAGVQAKLQVSRPVAGCQVAPAVDRDLDGADGAAAAVRRVPATVCGVPAVTSIVAGVVIAGVGATVSVDAARRRQAALERSGLDAHVGEQVHGGLLHRGVRRGAAALVGPVEAPWPLHGSRAEHERVGAGAVRVAVERQVVRGRPGRVGRAVVLELLHPVHGGRREPDETGRARPVVEVLVPLVADRVVAERRDLARAQLPDRGAAPEPQPAVVGRDLQRRGAGVDA